MLEWSKLMQPPEFLEATRITLLNEDFVDYTVKCCGIKSSDRVLEVGCGTGIFCRYLAKGTSGVSYTGLDRDTGLLEAALPVGGENTVRYVCGSAYELPFPDESFDAVVSHTFFNCADRPKEAIAEMKRVCKPGGRICSVASMSLGYETWHTGFYPPECDWAEEIPKFQNEMAKVMHIIGCGVMDFNKGVPASKLPRFFAVSGLSKVSIYGLPRAFSMSNHALSAEKKERYARMLCTGEKKKLENVMELTDFCRYIPREACQNYLKNLEKRRDFWLAHPDDNRIWDWFGAAALLLTGVRE